MSSIEVRAGANVWFDGAMWQVDEVTGAGVRIRSGGTVREVHVGAFSESAGGCWLGPQPRPVSDRARVRYLVLG
ncbi:hypothetical protein [Arthrobacter castelli]|uniref:hypothetical protein n=1 Tax=Arthrobacter castelli TaxID=271431 RepID=UPI000429BD29|nr:hypothetical protein [Arthrobacter castelli]